MYWFKKIIRAILNLLPFLLFPLFFTSPSYALKHDYKSFSVLQPVLPDPASCQSFNLSTMRYFLDWSCSPESSNSPFAFTVGFSSSYYSDTSNLIRPTHNSSYLNYSNISNNQFLASDVYTMIGDPSISHTFGIYSQYYDSRYTGLSDRQKFYTIDDFGSNGKLPFRNSFNGLMSCDPFTNGAICTGLWNAAEYVSSKILPLPFTYGNAFFQGSAKSSSGTVYNHSLELKDIMGINPGEFSALTIPLYTLDDSFWTDSSELYQGRQLEFKGSFFFDDDYSLNPDLNTNGGFVKLNYGSIDSITGGWSIRESTCSLTHSYLGDTSSSYLKYSCKLSIPFDLLAFYPVIQFSGDSNYNFENYFLRTSGEWSFVSTLLITDNDSTPGSDFGVKQYGHDNPGQAEAEIAANDNSVDPDFFDSLTSLFWFQLLNPFVPLYSLFTSGDQCVSIPTLASMLHSEESQVCPWFDPTVRNIVTPVVGLSSMMLLFGFFVRWLGGRSGNLFEDSFDTEGYHFESSHHSSFRSKGVKK